MKLLLEELHNFSSYLSIASSEIILFLTENMSNLHKILKLFAICVRFCNNCRLTGKNHLKRKQGLVDKEEINYAMIQILKSAKFNDFENKINDVKVQQLSKKSKLISLNPFLDSNSILCVGGRIGNALILYNTKHPF